MTVERSNGAPTSLDTGWPPRHAAALGDMVNDATLHVASARVYALLDVGADPALQAFARQLTDPSAALFDGTPQAGFAEYSPRLIELPISRLTHSSGAQSEPLLRLAGTHACVSWLVSDLPLQPLAVHLRGWLDGMLMDEDGSDLGEVLLRFFDARVLPGFMDMVTSEQYGEFMRPIVAWGVWLRSSRWQTWERPTVNPRRFPAPMQRYSMAQQRRLEASTRTDRMLARLRGIVRKEPDGADGKALNDFLVGQPHYAAYEALQAILNRATRLGLGADGDLLLFASLALTVAPNFDEHADIRESIQAAIETGRPFAHTLGSVPDDVWPALAAANRRPTATPALPF